VWGCGVGSWAPPPTPQPPNPQPPIPNPQSPIKKINNYILIYLSLKLKNKINKNIIYIMIKQFIILL